MDPDRAESVKRSIQEYSQRNSAMGGSRSFQGIQYVKGQTSSTTTCFTFATRRSQLYQSWNEEVFIYLDQEFLVCEIVDPYTSRSAQVAGAAAIKTKMTEKNAREVIRAKYKSPIQLKNRKGQEVIFKSITNPIGK